MTDEEMFEKLDEIEIRKSRERTIKSYVLRNNVISDKDRKIISQYMPDHGFPSPFAGPRRPCKFCFIIPRAHQNGVYAREIHG